MTQIFAGLLLFLMLLGCNKAPDKIQSAIPQQHNEIKLIRLSDAQLKTVSKKQLQVLAEAYEDIRQILQGREPKNVKIHAGAADGGTLWYKCDDYEIWSWKALGTFMGIDGHTRGVTIKFSSSYYRGNMEEFSYTWFESR
jgi:hypothetical protein